MVWNSYNDFQLEISTDDGQVEYIDINFCPFCGLEKFNIEHHKEKYKDEIKKYDEDQQYWEGKY